MTASETRSSHEGLPAPGLRSDFALVLAAWVLSLGVDFLLHAGVLARLYVREGPFLLPAESAFARIPLGYFTFLVLTISLWWLLNTLGVGSAARGLRVGLVSGAVLWGAFLVGLFSISTAPGDLLVGWWVGQSLELGVAGAVLGAGRSTASRRSIYLGVAVAVIACIIATVLLQVTGLAPVMDSNVIR